METADREKSDWKHKISGELLEYGLTFIYLAIFFAVFTWYRRLILAEYKITYLHYGISLLKAIVLAKVVMVGGTLGLGRQHADEPLIIPTLINTMIFCLWVALFDLLESTILGLIRGQGLGGGVREIMRVGLDELLARCLLIFFAFIPFFAFKALAPVLGRSRAVELFFGNRFVGIRNMLDEKSRGGGERDS